MTFVSNMDNEPLRVHVSLDKLPLTQDTTTKTTPTKGSTPVVPALKLSKTSVLDVSCVDASSEVAVKQPKTTMASLRAMADALVASPRMDAKIEKVAVKRQAGNLNIKVGSEFDPHTAPAAHSLVERIGISSITDKLIFPVSSIFCQSSNESLESARQHRESVTRNHSHLGVTALENMYCINEDVLHQQYVSIDPRPVIDFPMDDIVKTLTPRLLMAIIMLLLSNK